MTPLHNILKCENTAVEVKPGRLMLESCNNGIQASLNVIWDFPETLESLKSCLLVSACCMPKSFLCLGKNTHGMQKKNECEVMWWCEHLQTHHSTKFISTRPGCDVQHYTFKRSSLTNRMHLLYSEAVCNKAAPLQINPVLFWSCRDSSEFRCLTADFTLISEHIDSPSTASLWSELFTCACTVL